MHESLPLFPEGRRPRPRTIPPLCIESVTAPGDPNGHYERERAVLVSHWRRLCDELQAIDRRLDELDVLIGGW